MSTPLDPDHLKINEAFPWPDRWPDNLEEAIKFWEDYTPHKNVFILKPPPSETEIKDLKERLGYRPAPLKFFLERHNGIIFSWTRQRYVCPIDESSHLLVGYDIDTRIEELENDGKNVREYFFGELPYDLEKWDVDKFEPFGLDASGNTFCFYLGAETESGEIPIFKYHHHGHFTILNSSFANFLWYLNLYGHTHPQEYDKRLSKFKEKNIKLIFK